MDEVLAAAAEPASTAEVELIQGPSFPAQLYPRGLALEGSLESLDHCCQGLGQPSTLLRHLPSCCRQPREGTAQESLKPSCRALTLWQLFLEL